MLNEAILKMQDVFNAKTLLQGEEYFRNEKVLHLRLSDGLLKARIKGSLNQIYNVHMDLKQWPGIPARCTCLKQLNCKHVAACLFYLRDREQDNRQAPSTDRLDRKLDMWLENIRAQEAKNIHKPSTTHHLIYLVDLKLEGQEHQIKLKLALAKLLKKGGYGKKIVFNSLAESKKQYFQEVDNDIVAKLFYKCGVSGLFDVLTIRNSELLTQIIQTGRAFFIENEDDPIQMGEALTGTCQWELSSTGEQRLLLLNNNKSIVPLILDESWYCQHADFKMGPLTTSYPVKQLRHLLEAPPISLEQAVLLSEKMAQTCPEFPTPKVFTSRKVQEVKPIAVVKLDAYPLLDKKTTLTYSEEEKLHAIFVARITFDYDGLIISSDQTSPTLVRQVEDVLIEYQRDPAFEASKLSEVEAILQLRAPNFGEEQSLGLLEQETFVLTHMEKQADLDALYASSIPYLKTLGWRVDFVSTLYQEVLSSEEVEWFSDTQAHTTDFFSYQLGILVQGKQVSVVPLVADLIRRYSGNELDSLPDDQQIKLPLDDGRVLQIDLGRIKPLVRLILQLGFRPVDEQQQLIINAYQYMLLQEAELALVSVKSRWKGAETLRDELKQLTSLTSIPEVQAPIGLNAVLRDYQQDGLNWLQLMRKSHFNGVLADDMGLGKTVQTLAHLQYEKEQGRLNQASLIIAPTSLVGNWLAEANRFTPELKVLVYHGSERHLDAFNEFDLIISTYGLIQRDKDKFTTQHFYYLILDEAQFIKNARTKTTQIIQQIKASHRLCLTGTPLENHLGELWSLFHFLMPGLLGDAKQFRLWFRTPIEKNGNLDRRELLSRRVKPFMLRRTKNQVASELPPKTEMTRIIEILGPQRDLYETIRMSMEKKVRDAIAKQGLGKSHILLLDALLKLRQVCCDPRLLSLPAASMAHGYSSKLEALMELLDNLVEEGRRVLVFSQFTSMLKLIEEQLASRGYEYLKLTGQTQNRQALVNSFQEGKVPIFLISLKAGGTGLNLTKADTVIHYDPWWNPAVEDQATDRTHRIGQENPVFVYKLITAGTVEEAILGMQERKRELVNGILSTDSSKTISLTEADLAQFFMPLD